MVEIMNQFLKIISIVILIITLIYFTIYLFASNSDIPKNHKHIEMINKLDKCDFNISEVDKFPPFYEDYIFYIKVDEQKVDSLKMKECLSKNFDFELHQKVKGVRWQYINIYNKHNDYQYSFVIPSKEKEFFTKIIAYQ